MQYTKVRGLALVLALLPVTAIGVVASSGVANAVPTHITETMILLTGHGTGKAGWPKLTNSSWTVKKGETVTLRIVSHDDGTAPLVGKYMKYFKVMGTKGGTELAAGKSVNNISDINIAHTFTVTRLGLNLPIPVAPTGKTVTVVATFTPNKTGTFVWNCFAPCGTGPSSMGGPMATMGWMMGKIKVIA